MVVSTSLKTWLQHFSILASLSHDPKFARDCCNQAFLGWGKTQIDWPLSILHMDQNKRDRHWCAAFKEEKELRARPANTHSVKHLQKTMVQHGVYDLESGVTGPRTNYATEHSGQICRHLTFPTCKTEMVQSSQSVKYFDI